MLYAIARSRVGIDTAADVVQEAILRVWRNPDAFDPTRGSLAGYLRVLVTGISLDVVRRNASRSQREDRQHRETVELEDSRLDPLKHLLNQEMSKRVSEALLSLRDEERQPIVAAFYGRMTYREIAARTGIPEGTIKSRIRQGLKKLSVEFHDLSSPTRDQGLPSG